MKAWVGPPMPGRQGGAHARRRRSLGLPPLAPHSNVHSHFCIAAVHPKQTEIPPGHGATSCSLAAAASSAGASAFAAATCACTGGQHAAGGQLWPVHPCMQHKRVVYTCVSTAPPNQQNAHARQSEAALDGRQSLSTSQPNQPACVKRRGAIVCRLPLLAPATGLLASCLALLAPDSGSGAVLQQHAHSCCLLLCRALSFHCCCWQAGPAAGLAGAPAPAAPAAVAQALAGGALAAHAAAAAAAAATAVAAHAHAGHPLLLPLLPRLWRRALLCRQRPIPPRCHPHYLGTAGRGAGTATRRRCWPRRLAGRGSCRAAAAGTAEPLLPREPAAQPAPLGWCGV